ncbi:MAG: hypothetical protein ABID40_03960 [Candidatus Bipolaricaulota bacterium]
MAKRILGGLVVGTLLLAGTALAQGAVELPPAEVEVVALEQAFAQVTDFFKGLITEFKGSLTMLQAEVRVLERQSLALQMGLEEIAGRVVKIEATILPLIRGLEGRIAALEKHDIGSLERRLGALDKATEALLVKIDNNRAKIEGLETALVAFSADSELCMSVAGETKAEVAAQRQEIETLSAEFTRLAQQQQAQWSAIFLVPIVVGGLLYLLLSQGG